MCTGQTVSRTFLILIRSHLVRVKLQEMPHVRSLEVVRVVQTIFVRILQHVRQEAMGVRHRQEKHHPLHHSLNVIKIQPLMLDFCMMKTAMASLIRVTDGSKVRQVHVAATR